MDPEVQEDRVGREVPVDLEVLGDQVDPGVLAAQVALEAPEALRQHLSRESLQNAQVHPVVQVDLEVQEVLEAQVDPVAQGGLVDQQPNGQVYLEL